MGWPSSSSSSTVASWALLSWTRWTRMVHLLLLEQNIRSSQEYHMPVSGTSVHIIQKVVTDHEGRASERINHQHPSVFGSANERLESLLDALLGSLLPTILLEVGEVPERGFQLGP